MADTQRVTIDMPADLWVSLGVLASEHERSRAYFVREAVRRLLADVNGIVVDGGGGPTVEVAGKASGVPVEPKAAESPVPAKAQVLAELRAKEQEIVKAPCSHRWDRVREGSPALACKLCGERKLG